MLIRNIVIATLLTPAFLREVAASNLSVRPVKVHLSRNKQSAMILLSNHSQHVVHAQADAFTWLQNEQGEIRLEPTTAISVFPPLVVLRAGESKSFRVFLRAAASSLEQSYRLVIEELPTETGENRGSVQLRTRRSIPVFVAPLNNPDPIPRISIHGFKQEQLVFFVENRGNTHFFVDELRVEGIQSTQAGSTGGVQLKGWYVLPQSRQRFEIALPREACREASHVRILMRTLGKTHANMTLLPSAVCP